MDDTQTQMELDLDVDKPDLNEDDHALQDPNLTPENIDPVIQNITMVGVGSSTPELHVMFEGNIKSPVLSIHKLINPVTAQQVSDIFAGLV